MFPFQSLIIESCQVLLLSPLQCSSSYVFSIWKTFAWIMDVCLLLYTHIYCLEWAMMCLLLLFSLSNWEGKSNNVPWETNYSWFSSMHWFPGLKNLEDASFTSILYICTQKTPRSAWICIQYVPCIHYSLPLYQSIIICILWPFKCTSSTEVVSALLAKKL